MFQSKLEEEEELSIVSIHVEGTQHGSCPLSWGRKQCRDWRWFLDLSRVFSVEFTGQVGNRIASSCSLLVSLL